MGFLDECKSETRPKQQPIIESLIADWSKKDRDEFEAALDDVTVSTMAIVKVLNRRGTKISYNAVAKYRRERI